MRNIILPTIILVLLVAGFQFYFEVAKRDFEKSLPQVPEPVEQQNAAAPSESLDVEDAPETGLEEGTAAVAAPSAQTHVPEDDAAVNVDWREDTHDSHLHEVDPWHQIHSQKAEEGAKGTPPKVRWFEIADPYERAAANRAQLVKQFGDIPEVHTHVDIDLKLQLGMFTTLDEEIALYEATYSLWPHEETLKSLKRARAAKAAASRARTFSH